MGKRRVRVAADDLIQTFEVTFSEDGSSWRGREESVYRDFVRYVREVEGMLCIFIRNMMH